MPKYAICRILGNELPPRDLPGSRLAVFDFILNHEYVEDQAKRIWILNRFLDRQLLSTIKTKLTTANEQYVELGIDWDKYTTSLSRTKRLTTLVGINQARNAAFKVGAEQADFVFILDGDCFFDKNAWTTAIAGIEQDQSNHKDRKYYALPSARVFLDDGPDFNTEQVELEEPMLLLRNDSKELFHENSVFGQDDKVQLLLKLGLRSQGHFWYPLNSEGACLVVGHILHLSTSPKEVELDNWARHILRRESLNRLLAKADDIAARHMFTYSVTRALTFKACSHLLAAIETVAFAAQKLWFQVKFAVRKLWIGT